MPLAPIDRIYLYGDVTLTATILAKLGEIRNWCYLLIRKKTSTDIINGETA
ncbi:hypothetical protein INT80_05455 [Gallibacterium anatis]|uniref:Uncharacterized protein n=1 Tax=Gallibacterium anatis TaxID=750 RepID=A0A930Y3R0_9PAST|nr:hypothetical protein [Gallibacterium anatis]